MDLTRQPNLVNLANHLRGPGELVPNLPALDQGGQILQLLQEIRLEIRQNKQEIREEMLRYDRNNLARVVNSTITRSDAQLEPFYGINNQVIPDFPETGEALGGLTGLQINQLPEALGLPTDGQVGARRARFAKNIGYPAMSFSFL